jgi:HAD superfamily phosphatase (TIGR01668 family)
MSDKEQVQSTSKLNFMSWNELLQPDLILEDSILSLTPDIIQQYRLKGLVLDVDETLVSIKATEASAELRQWVEQTRQVTALWLVSNNLSDMRIGGIARSLNLPIFLVLLSRHDVS